MPAAPDFLRFAIRAPLLQRSGVVGKGLGTPFTVSVFGKPSCSNCFGARRNARSRGNRIVSRVFARGRTAAPLFARQLACQLAEGGADQMQQVSSLLANQPVRSERRQLAGPRLGTFGVLGTDAGRGPAVLLRLPAVLSTIPNGRPMRWPGSKRPITEAEEGTR